MGNNITSATSLLAATTIQTAAAIDPAPAAAADETAVAGGLTGSDSANEKTRSSSADPDTDTETDMMTSEDQNTGRGGEGGWVIGLLVGNCYILCIMI